MPDTTSALQGFSITEAAQRLSLHRSSVYRLIASGQLKVVRIGRRTIVPAAEIERLLTQGAEIPTAS